MARKKTIAQKRDARKEKVAKNKTKPKSASPIDKLVAQINDVLGGVGRVYTGAEIEKQEYERRLWGIPSLDFILNGGLPRPGLVEIGGEYSTGKTTLALHACANAQRTEPDLAIGWIALEPFSKRWARENGLWIPFHEEKDPYDGASELEQYRMEQWGIEDPHSSKGLAEVVVVQEERGDVALDAALTMIRSNLCSIVVVDSLGVAKSTKWLEESDVQDHGDFPREARMINDYTTRAVLALNARYDENNQKMAKGTRKLRTTVIHIQHIMTAIGTMAKAPWNKQIIKGGEGQKFNHHAIIFLYKGQQKAEKMNQGRYMYGQEVNCIAIKSKIGPPYRQGKIDLYVQPWGEWKAGDIDVAKDAVSLGLIAGLIERNGSWFTFGEERRQGREGIEKLVREDPDLLEWLVTEAINHLRQA